MHVSPRLAVIVGVCLLLAAQSAVAQKRIIYIYDSAPLVNEAPAVDHNRHDQNVMDALSGGLTVEGTPIAGLGYQIIPVDLETTADAADYTAADGDLVIISNSVDSGAPAFHTDDPIPVINTEAALNNNTDTPGRSEMFFGSGEGSTLANDFNIVDVTHPITSIFTQGPLTIGQGAARIGYAGGTLATNVTPLAENPGNAGQKTLAVAEAGSSGLIPPASGMPPGVEPLPARRVVLGYHAALLTTPTVNGVYLLQRTVQWTIGDPVTAGEVAQPPNAPTNLNAAALNSQIITLTWTDNATNETGFEIQRKEGASGTYAPLTTVGPDVITHNDIGLNPETTYFYQVRAVNTAGQSAWSNEASATTPASSLDARKWTRYK